MYPNGGEQVSEAQEIVRRARARADARADRPRIDYDAANKLWRSRKRR